MEAAVIAQILIAILPFVKTGVADLIKVIESHRADAKAQDQWTDEQDAAFRASVFSKTQDPAYAPDAPKA